MSSPSASSPSASSPSAVTHASPPSLWRLRSYVRPYTAQMLLMGLAAAAGVGASLVVPLVIGAVVDGPIRHGDRGGLVELAGLAALLGLAEAGLVFLRRWLQSGAALALEADLRRDLYRHLQRLPVAFHDRWQSGQLLSRATMDLSTIRRFVSFGLIFLVVNIATFVVVVVVLVRMYAPLGLAVAVGAIPLFEISRRLARNYQQVSRRVQDQQGDLATFIEESAAGVRAIRAFDRAEHMGARFRAGARTLHDSSVERAVMVARYWAAFDMVPGITLAAVLAGGAYAVARGLMTLGDLVAFVSLTLMLVWPVDSLGWILADAHEAATAADRVFEVLDTVPAIVDRPGAVDLPPPVARQPAPDPQPAPDRQSTPARRPGKADRPGGVELRFAGVAFTYPGASTPVLHDVSLVVRPGETMALVGVTGAGKTTMAALVPRLYDVSAGRVLVDGHDVRDLTLASLRTLVAVAFEEATLFSASVRENVALGAPDATDEQVRAALAVAQAGFVDDLPWGLDTRIGEQGLSLSGGQRQRLALARAVLARPAVLVLDDPLSALDVHTEALVEQALGRVLGATTALLVAHRPSTVALADRVALVADGTITAVGTHHDLLASVPAYRAVISQQADDLPDVVAGDTR